MKIKKDLKIKHKRLEKLRGIESPTQKLTFNELEGYLNEHLKDSKFEKTMLMTNKGKYNYNAFLLSDQNDIAIKLIEYAGTTNEKIINSYEYGKCSLITAVNKVLEKLEIKEILYDEEKNNIDKQALKEAVINSVIHNDYSSGDAPIIEVYSDRIEVISAGGLILSMTQKEFFDGMSLSRNPELTKIFERVGLVNNSGLGILRILDSYKKNCFEFGWNYLKVCFKYNPKTYITTTS